MKTVNVGDVTLQVVDQGSGPTLLLAHGFPLDHTMWKGQIGTLADHCRVVAPDLRGFGRSGVTEGTVTMEQLADDLAVLLDQLGANDPVVFCGLSMGGYVAWQFWRKHAARVARLILCDTRAGGDSEQVARGRLMMAQRVLREGPEFVAKAMLPKLFAPVTLQKRPDILDVTRQMILHTTPAGIAAAQRGMAQRPDASGMLHDIDVPTLVLCGEEDQISRPEQMRKMAALIPDARYLEVPAAGHMAPLENPAAVNAAILEFLPLA